MTAVADRRSPTELRHAGCICEFGCRSCGIHESQMGNCPAFSSCPIGRAPHARCPVHRVSEQCDNCGTDVTENWEGGPNLTKLCPDCAEGAWDDE